MKPVFLQRIAGWMPLVRQHVWRLLKWHSRLLLRIALGIALLLAGIAAAWQFWLIPRLENYRPALIAELTRAAGMPVQVGTIRGGWEGFRPELSLGEISVLDPAGVPALRLARLEGALSWWALPMGRLHFSRIELVQPDLTLTRLQDGRWRVAGVVLEQKEGDSGFINWLLDQGGLSLQKGRLVVIDERTPGSPLELRDLDLQAGNFLSRRKISFGFTPPAEIGDRVSGEGMLSGSDINRLKEWSGQVRFNLSRVDLARLDARINALVPRDSAKWPRMESGTGRLSLKFVFDSAVLEKLDADLGVEKFRFVRGKLRFDLPFFDAGVHWQMDKKREQLTVDARRIDGAAGPLASNGRFEYKLQDDEREFLLRNFTLQGLSGYAAWLPDAWARKLAGNKLAGDVGTLRYAWKGDWMQPERWRGEFKLANLDIVVPEVLPKLGRLDLSGKFDQKGGSASASSKALEFSWPKQFIEPLSFSDFQAGVSWKHSKEKGWEVDVQRLALSNADAAVSVTAKWQYAGEKLGTIDLNGSIERAVASRVYAYLPRAVDDKTLAWLKNALRAGNAFNGKATLQGDLAQFPFADGKSGKFLITADARNVTLDYGKGWPALTGIDGDMRFEGQSMTIRAQRANTSGAHLKDVVTRIPDLTNNQHVLVEGKAEGATSAFLRFVHDSPVRQATHDFLEGAKAEGNGQLDLNLDIPISKPDDAKVKGQFRFANNKLDLGRGIPPLTQAGAHVDFSESGLKISDAGGRALGGSVKLAGANDSNGQLKLSINGDARLQDLARQFKLPQAKRHAGALSYQGDLGVRRDRYELVLQSSLAGARFDFPAPLGKPANETRPLRVKLNGDSQRQALEFSYGSQLQGTLASLGDKPYAGVINIGTAQPAGLMPGKGILLTGRLPETNLDAWSDLLEGEGGTDTAAISGVDLRFDRLGVKGKQLNEVRIKAAPSAQGWAVQLASKEASGQINWRGGSQARVTARMERLALPFADQDDADAVVVTPLEQGKPAAKTSTKPHLDLVVENFRYKESNLGQLIVEAAPLGDGWQLNKVSLANPDGRFTMTGQWLGSGTNERTMARMNLSSENTGKLLARLGYPDALKRAPTEITAEGSWYGSPFSPDYKTIQGKLHLDVKAGQFAKIEPGAGRLLSVISLQSLTRRVKLDFSDVFSEGMAFDTISGDAVINRGIARTDNLAIDGPSAKVRFKGETDLAAGTQNLRVRVTPLVGNAAALAVGVVNPIAGAAAFVVQQVLKDPLGQLISYEYDITGEWANPKVTKVKR
ncbi:YhdP family protein [Formivibrio citricus]|nr:YhdP family protein [Formivibrio citricus]